MPELPEVEVLVRHLAPRVIGRTILSVDIRRIRVLAPTSPRTLSSVLRGARFVGLRRRAKYLVFNLHSPSRGTAITLVGHLGMTGRMYLLPYDAPLPKHAAVVLDLDRGRFVFEDTRYFGRLTLDVRALEKLGMEPLEAEFTPERFAEALKRSGQPIKVKLLDQSAVAGVGNIYASEALFRAGISPRTQARRLKNEQIKRLWNSIREVLQQAIELGSSLPLAYSGTGAKDGLFYFGRAPAAADMYEERFRVYDRAGKPCLECGAVIKRFVQAARSTFYCPVCQGSSTTMSVRQSRP